MMMTTKTRRIAAAAVLFTFLPLAVPLPHAHAQDDASTVQARARFKEGVEAYDKGKFEEARLSFLQAYTLKKHPSVLLNLAQSSAKSNHPLDAAKYFQQFLKEATTATPQQKKDAEKGLEEVRQKIARIDVVAPAGTDISLDDHGKVGTTPFEPLDVEPGIHTVKSPSQTVTVTAVVGQKVKADFSAPAPKEPAVTPVTPPPSTEPPKDPAPPADEVRYEEKANHVPAIILTAAAGVGALTTIIFAAFRADAQSKADEVANEIRAAARRDGLQQQGVCNSGQAQFADACRVLRDNNSKVDTNATVANVALVATLILAAGAIYFWVAPPKSKHRVSGFQPFVGPQNGFSFTF